MECACIERLTHDILRINFGFGLAWQNIREIKKNQTRFIWKVLTSVLKGFAKLKCLVSCLINRTELSMTHCFAHDLTVLIIHEKKQAFMDLRKKKTYRGMERICS